MDKNKLITLLKKLLNNRIFNYIGPIVTTEDFIVDFDYKVEVLNIRQMISVGEYYDYLFVKVNVVKLNNQNSKVFFEKIVELEDEQLNRILPNLYQFTNKIEYDIKSNFVQFIVPELRVTLQEMTISIPKPITEQRMFRHPVRTIVKDILTVLKNEEEGEFYLPENDDYGMGYSFDNIPAQFTVELHIKIDNIINNFKINAYYSEDDDVIEVLIVYNPNDLKQSLYDIVGELNEVITHELEHILQNYRGELPSKKISTKNPLKYYTQPHEISAQVAGFKRLSKLRKIPFENVVRDWFDTHKDIHNLKPKEVEIVINKLLNYIK